MPDDAGSLRGRAAAAACLWLAFATCTFAQPPLPSPIDPPSAPEFLPRAAFQLSAAVLSIDDPRFTWDTHFGGELDIVDYVVGRVNVVADYEAMLGNEFRLFDPNQSLYTLEASASGRAAETEIAGVFHHESRHLSDRPKRQAIAWNAVGVRVLRRLHVSSTTFDVQAGIGRVVQHAFVDYGWTSNLDIAIRRPVTPRVAVFVHGSGELFGIDSSVSARNTQKEGRAEAGLRITGPAAAAELFAGFERRIDADALDRQAQRWTLVGFRLVSR